MKEWFTNKTPLLLILLLTLVFAKLQINKRDSGKDICFNICGDARGYYAWLPAIFIYHDLNFTFFDTVEQPDSVCGCKAALPIQDYRYSLAGRPYNKYYPGSSFMMLPLFAIAHITTLYFTHYPPSGYSQLYFIFMGLSGIFYYFLGMLFFLKLLRKLELDNAQQSLTILLVTLGTNLIYYAIDAPLYSHVYSFTLIAAFLYYSFYLRENSSAKNILWLSFLTGFIFITRPVNITILLVLPFILGENIKTIRRQFTDQPKYYSALLLPVFIMPAILFILYKIATGHFVIYAYGKEGFTFLHPHLYSFLFQYDNGVIPYTPLLVMPFLLLFAWYAPAYRNIVRGALLTLIVTIYIHSSWWAWDYGYSFGARTLLDFGPLFGMVIGLSLKQASVKRYMLLLPPYFLCCALTIILYHQKSHGGFMNHYPITDYRAAIHNALGIR